jgi:LPS-assembly protein
MTTTMIRAAVAIFLLIASSAAAATAAGDWLLCGAGLAIPEYPADAVALDPTNPDATQLGADAAELESGGSSVLTGNVFVRDIEQLLRADRVRYDQSNETIEATGNLRYWRDAGYATADRAKVSFDTDIIEMDQGTYLSLDGHMRTEAGFLKITGSELIEIETGRYTTCNPDDEAWHLEAKSIDLDRVRQWGEARDVTVHFMDVPIFYSPYLTFPLDDARKTGFLVPNFRLSGDAGTEVVVPYYFNLAPNRDATLAARLTSERGIGVVGEYRYLTPWGGGELDAELFPHDPEEDDTRALLKFRHQGEFAPRWDLELQYDRASDRQYFEHFGNSLSVSSTTHLRQRANVGYRGDNWNARVRVESYQTIDPTIPGADRPYKRLPQVLIRSRIPERNFRINFDADAEYVNFDRRDSVTGHRIDIRPSVSYPMRWNSGFFLPKATLQYTAYDLDDRPAGASDDPDRLLPTISVDTGLFFERPIHIGGSGFTQTLEPRLYYLAVPFDDQRDLPVFDTGELTFSFAQLFRENRFNGTDRLGDAHQLTMALASRLLSSDSGREVLRASVGQILYFRDRVVTLPDVERATTNTSDFVAELSAELGPSWSALAGFQWDPDNDRTDRNVFSLRYQPSSDRVLNLSYRFIRDAVEQVDLSTRWPWSNHVSLVGRLNYSLDAGSLVEGFAGVEYDSCCWAMRAVARRYLTNTDGDYNNALFLQFELKGLAGIGKKAEAFLQRSIPGYTNDF